MQLSHCNPSAVLQRGCFECLWVDELERAGIIVHSCMVVQSCAHGHKLAVRQLMQSMPNTMASHTPELGDQAQTRRNTYGESWNCRLHLKLPHTCLGHSESCLIKGVEGLALKVLTHVNPCRDTMLEFSDRNMEDFAKGGGHFFC